MTLAVGKPLAEPSTSASLRLGLALAALMAALALIGPWLPLQDPQRQDLLAALAPPSSAHWLGTDHLGRDVLSRCVHGASRSLGIAVACVGVAAALGLLLGLAGALSGRFAEALVMRLADLVLAFPGLLLALLFAGFLGGGIIPMMIGVKLALWPQFARMARAQARVTLSEAHVEAARLAGLPGWHVLVHHLLPPVLRQTMPLATLGVGSAVLSISSLGFLGLGLQPPTPEWGQMISELLPYAAEAPIQLAAPCLLIMLSVLALTLVGESLAGRFAGATP